MNENGKSKTPSRSNHAGEIYEVTEARFLLEDGEGWDKSLPGGNWAKEHAEGEDYYALRPGDELIGQPDPERREYAIVLLAKKNGVAWVGFDSEEDLASCGWIKRKA